MELLDVVDENGIPTGETVDRKKAHKVGIRHRTAHVWVLRKKNGKIQVLLQKRSANKDSNPGKYDCSSAGHIPAGDDFETSAIRELKEELGVDVKEEQLIYVYSKCGRREEQFYGKPFIDFQYSNVYVTWIDMDDDNFTVQKEELELVKWFDYEQCVEMVENNKINCCISIKEIKKIAEVM